MHYPVNPEKATQAVARLIQQSNGPVDYLRIVKLAYLADRESIARRGLPIIGGKYFSMAKGPVISEVMDFVKQRNAPGWKHSISTRMGNEIRLEQANLVFDNLSSSEVEILDGVVQRHRDKTTEELVAWCHRNCSEYEDVGPSQRLPIEVEEILKAVGKSPQAVEALVSEKQSLEKLEALLA